MDTSVWWDGLERTERARVASGSDVGVGSLATDRRMATLRDWNCRRSSRLPDSFRIMASLESSVCSTRRVSGRSTVRSPGSDHALETPIGCVGFAGANNARTPPW